MRAEVMLFSLKGGFLTEIGKKRSDSPPKLPDDILWRWVLSRLIFTYYTIARIMVTGSSPTRFFISSNHALACSIIDIK